MDYAQHNWENFCRYHAGDWYGGSVSIALIDLVNPLEFMEYTEGDQLK